MALRLGEMLVRAGHITPEQLDEALKSQVIFGGRLGTNLIEMGCIEEEELAKVLSEKLRVPRVSPDELMNIPPSIVEVMPLELARQYQAVPLRRENRRLFVVMADPSDLQAIDQIAFSTGHVIVPMVSPEIWLLKALEKYYGIKREIRSLPVSKGMGGRKVCNYQARPADAAFAAPREVVDFSTLPQEEEDYFPWVDGGYDNPRIEAAQRYTIDTMSRALADAPDRDAVAAALVSYMGQEFDRAALLLVTRDAVAGWMAMDGGNPVSGFDELKIGLDEPSVLLSVVNAKVPYWGPIAGTPANLRLLAALGGGEPEGVLLVPLVMNNRVVAMLCTLGGLELLGALREGLQTVARKAVLAFEVLILKNKILMT
ncbi:general secretion pathway protein GspE [Geobacter benzoatilyticus]|uniref:General secretion pathway protein GspE n=1 Tax=Geobacter benzoatilyticus TaxID=2815309 RepID=A0ABX7Q669_9BACT|nr:general secretion pathway protein GspE [Geobacter benzoatilyticus]QSV46595.1 general secretion pathway protein GspE [Geobacter benzoatilyticus]